MIKFQSLIWKLNLKGPSKNINAVGAKIIVYDSNEIRTYEKYPVRGFQSSMEIPMHIGLDKTKVDSILLIWPDNTYQPVQWKNAVSTQINIQYQHGLPKYDYSKINKSLEKSVTGKWLILQRM